MKRDELQQPSIHRGHHISSGVKVLDLQFVFRGRWDTESRTASFNAMILGPTETTLCEKESSEVGVAHGIRVWSAAISPVARGRF